MEFKDAVPQTRDVVVTLALRVLPWLRSFAHVHGPLIPAASIATHHDRAKSRAARGRGLGTRRPAASGLGASQPGDGVLSGNYRLAGCGAAGNPEPWARSLARHESPAIRHNFGVP